MVLPLGDVEKTRITPIATYLLIAINLVMFAVETRKGPQFRTSYSATPYEITHAFDITEPVAIVLEPDEQGRVPKVPNEIPHGPGPFPILLTLLTSLFLHADPLHIAGNMLFLWIFGDNVEEVFGTFLYVLAYLSCGLIGTLAQVALEPDSIVPTLGASGAIAGMMGAYIIWFPHNRVRVLFFSFLTEMPAYLVIGAWILLQIAGGYGSLGQIGALGGVGYLAHIGGASTGLFLGLLFHNRAIAVQAEAYRDAWSEPR